MYSMILRNLFSNWPHLLMGLVATVTQVVFIFSVGSVIFAHITDASWTDASLDVLTYATVASLINMTMAGINLLYQWILDWRLSRWSRLSS